MIFAHSAKFAGFAAFTGALIAAITARLPVLFQQRPYGDEALYALMGHQWLNGSAPYTILADMKPPGIFGLYAVAEAIMQDPLLAPRVLPFLAILATAAALWCLGLEWFADRCAASLASFLYPFYTVVLGGTFDTTELLLAPFAAFGLLAASKPGIAPALVAGLLFGIAGTIKQIIAFEAALGLMFIISVNSNRGARVAASTATYLVGAVTPTFCFAIYYAFIGHIHDLWLMSVVWAALRTGSYVSALEGPIRLLGALKPLLPLVVLSAFLVTERRWFRGRRPPAHFGRVAAWLLVALLGVLMQRAVYDHYLLTLAPPLTLLAALFLSELNRRAAWFGTWMLIASVAILAAIPPILVTISGGWPSGDRDTPAIAEKLRSLGLIEGRGPGELYVIDHEPVLYLLTETVQPTRFAYPEHLQCDFTLPPRVNAEEEIERAMAIRSRFVVISQRRSRLMCTQADRMALYLRRLEAEYQLAARVGDRDPVEIYVLR